LSVIALLLPAATGRSQAAACTGMHAGRRAAAWLAVLLCVAWIAAAQAQIAVPRLSARVTDLTGTLTGEQRQALETRLQEFETRKGAQLAVLLVPTTQPETIEQYARRVLDEWKLGRKGIDDGALLLVALKDRKLRIETQYGLEGVLPDAIAKRIIDEIVTPRFRQQDFYGGISAGVERMISVIDGEPLPPPPERAARSEAPGSNIESLLMVGFALVFVVAGILRAMFGRVGGAALTGGIGAIIAWFIVGSLIAAGAVALIVFVLSTIMGVAGMGRGMRRGGWTGGGGMGGGSWGGGGGWSGGGGMGGGGGASGSW
jgi:uncharacterized protein